MGDEWIVTKSSKVPGSEGNDHPRANSISDYTLQSLDMVTSMMSQ